MIKKRVLMAVYSHYSSDARVRRYVESLARKNYQVDIVCIKEKYTPQKKNINLIFYPLDRKRVGFFWYFIEYLLFFLFCTITITYKQLINRYSFVHIHNMPDFLVFSAVLPKLMGSKIILDMHDPMPELFMTKFGVDSKSLGVRSLKYIEKLTMCFADTVLTANDEFKKVFIKRRSVFPEKIHTIMNLPDPNIFKKFTSKNRQSNVFKQKPFTLFYMGTIEKRFGLDLVIDSMIYLTQQIPNIRLILIPKIEKEGEYFKNLKLKIRNSKLDKYIKILPPKSIEEITNLLTMADIGLVLAKDGLFTQMITPVKLLEFIQCEVPVIATKTKSLAKLFSKKQIYFLQKDSVQEFQTAVLRFYKNNELRHKQITEAKKYLTTNNWIKEKKKYLKLVN
jgi:glycosyltransferase involved in cell wall biosynthesis